MKKLEIVVRSEKLDDGEYDQHTLDVPAHGEPHVKCTQDTGKQSQNSYPCGLFEILPEALEEQLDHAALTVSDAFHGGVVECCGRCTYREDWQGSQQPQKMQYYYIAHYG